MKVVGAVKGDGTVELHDSTTVERTTAPEDVPHGSIAIQCRTAGTALDWMDGWVLFCKEPDGIDPGYLGRFCFAKVKEGATVIAMVKRGYRDNTVNLSGPISKESVSLEWASPILWTRN